MFVGIEVIVSRTIELDIINIIVCINFESRIICQNMFPPSRISASIFCYEQAHTDNNLKSGKNPERKLNILLQFLSSYELNSINKYTNIFCVNDRIKALSLSYII